MKKRSGFGSTFGNILTGMMIYHVTSSLVGGMFGQKRPYNVYNYYNQPPEAKQEIQMSSNMLTLCEGNATNACIKGKRLWRWGKIYFKVNDDFLFYIKNECLVTQTNNFYNIF